MDITLVIRAGGCSRRNVAVSFNDMACHREAVPVNCFGGIRIVDLVAGKDIQASRPLVLCMVVEIV